jgi:predicted dehydrogenase
MATSPTNNIRPAGPQLRVACIADAEALPQVGPVWRASPLVEIAGLAGMPKSAAWTDVPWFDDPRQLLAQKDLQAVVLATSTRSDIGLATVALERGLPVWRLPPLARNFAEAGEIAATVKRHGAVYRVASWWEHVAEHAWRDLAWPEDFRPGLSELRVSTPGPAAVSWRAKLSEVGGGVLAQDAYGWLEALIAVRGLPESAYASVSARRLAAGTSPRETEDTGVAILHYADHGLALVRATWEVPPFEQVLAHHSRAATVAVSPDEATLLDQAGAIGDRRPLPADFLAGELHRFADWVRGAAHDRALDALERHLAVQALLETLYLSARTNHPESPRKLYEAQGRALPRS